MSDKRVARLMRERCIQGASRRKSFKTTVRDRDARPAPDLVNRQFRAEAPDQLWVADITYVPTAAGFLFLAIVLDVYSRRVVGWAMATHMRTELVLDALEMAIHRRQPRNVIHHSDQGTQYTSIAFSKRCNDAGVRLSMGSTGDYYDNAMCESFNAILREAAPAVFDFIEGFYNPRRRHTGDWQHLTYGIRTAESSRLMSNFNLSTKGGQLHDVQSRSPRQRVQLRSR